MKNDMKLLGLQPEWAIFRDMWIERLDMGQTSNPSLRSVEKKDVFK